MNYYRQEIAEITPDIDIYTEYALFLQSVGLIQDSIKYYNSALDLSIKGCGAFQMETYPTDFRADGSDYDAKEFDAVIHIMRAMNSADNDPTRILAERQSAIDADPNSAIVEYYDGVLAQKADNGFKIQAFERSQKEGANVQSTAAPAAAPN